MFRISTLHFRILLLLAVSILFALPGITQSTAPFLIKKLLGVNSSIPQITSYDLSALVIPSNKDYADNDKYLIKTTEGLFVGIEGTGLLFHVTLEQDTLAYKRVETTKYAGYNFYAAHFTFQEKIYSFGGYGFWKTNGGMRVFNPLSKEWDIVPLLEEKPNIFYPISSGLTLRLPKDKIQKEVFQNVKSMPSLYWMDAKNGHFYTIGQRTINESTKEIHSFFPEINALDIRNGSWKTIGKLKRYGWQQYVALPQGLLIHESSTHFYLADFIRNQILYPDNYLETELSKLNSGSEINILFAVDSTIYFGNLRNNTIDSIILKKSHLISKKEEIYSAQFKMGESPYKCPKSLFAIIGLNILIVTGIFFAFSRRKKDKVSIIQHTETPNVDTQTVFTEVEKSLIQLLLEKAEKNDTASIEDLNKILGVTTKADPIKRKVRSEIIQSINLKWGVMNQSNEKLIFSTRLAQDKRSREYFIKEKMLTSPELMSILKQ